ncbi:MAG TPA: hypothetical protein VKZ59_14910, partial [Acidobacteriota bacterium]|nr:hypothetical protein [Acidobacteriota bacterium]
FDVGQRKLTATQWVGCLGIGKYTLEVVPKIDRADASLSDLQTRQNLLFMVARAKRIAITEADIVLLANSGQPLISAFLELYIKQLSFEWRRGAIRQYVHLDRNRAVLKGKLLFSDQIKRNFIHRERFYTTCDEFIPNNRIAQLLKAALRKCHVPFLRVATEQRIKHLLAEFDEVEDRDFTFEEMKNIRVDRSLERYRTLVTLAKFILQEVSPSTDLDPTDGVYSFMFDMNQIFEGFIAAELRSAFLDTGFNVRSQFASQSLLLREGRRKFYLKPDLGVFLKSKPICLLDTKWKRLDRSKPNDNVSHADMYQMYAYGKEYDCPRVVLLYPRHGTLPLSVAEYIHPEKGTEPPRVVVVGTVDISAPMHVSFSLTDLRRDLVEIALGNLVPEEKRRTPAGSLA